MEAGRARPANVDLPIYRGDPVDAPFRLYTTPDPTAVPLVKDYLDLTGYTGRAQVRDEAGTTVLLELTVTVAPVQAGATKGKVTVSATAAQTAALAPGLDVWDLELTPPGPGVQPRTWLAGSVPVEADVTR